MHANAEGRCDRAGVLCYLGLGAVVAAGGSYYAGSQLKYALSPWMPVKVELADGSVVSAKLSPKAKGGRFIKAEDTLRLKCKEANALCELLVLRQDPRASPYPRGSALYGHQPSIIISVRGGVPNPEMLTIEGTVLSPVSNAAASGVAPQTARQSAQ